MRTILIVALILGGVGSPAQERTVMVESSPVAILKTVDVKEISSLVKTDMVLSESVNIPVVSQPSKVSGDCASWLAAAGVSDISSAMTLINRESGCDPSIVNPSSGSCGVAQELPCGKSGCSLGEGACQVRWMNSYILERYGSWTNALGHSFSQGWY